MATTLSPNPRIQFFDANGNPLAGGKLYTYAAGTTTPLATYTSYSGSVANSNPIILDARGECALWCGSAQYYMILKDATDVQIWAVDNINGPNGPTLAALAASNGATLIGYTESDSGDVTTVNDRLQLLDGVSVDAGPTDSIQKASINVFRDASAVVGGTAGFVNTAIYSRLLTGPTETAFEWNIVAVLDNYGGGSTENVAAYFQGNKYGIGSTWGSVSEAKDYTNTADPTGGLVGFEVDVYANGTDVNNARIGIDLVGGKGIPAGTKPDIYCGIRLGPQGADPTQATFVNGIYFTGEFTTSIRMSATGTTGILMNGTTTTGIDLSTGTHTTSIKLKELSPISFEATNKAKMFYFSGTGLNYQYNGVTILSMADSGNINIFGPILINNLQVVNVRQTGYSAFTGTTNAGSVYATSTVTLQQLAERVAAIQASLSVHGLIGA